MIEVCRHSKGMSIKGHAGYAAAGQDIVCAAVSVLVQTLIASLENLTIDRIEYEMEAGFVEIKHGRLTIAARLLFDSFFIGIQMIANEYPHYVQIV